MAEEKIKKLVESFPDSGKELLQNIIYGFAEEGIVFTNESQFQFQIGYELQKLFDKYKMNYKVKFEVLSLNKYNMGEFFAQPKDEKEKFYTDLVIEMPNNKCVAIELKYKTALPSKTKLFKYTVNKNNYITFAQGAYDNGCYDYWWDVRRLEQFVDKKIKYNFSSREVIKGFAIIMSNDENYWNKHRDGYFRNFMLTDTGDEFVKGKRLWRLNGKDVEKIEEKKSTSKRYLKSIDINGEYKLNWKDYILPENTTCTLLKENFEDVQDYNKYKFRFLIIDVNKNND